MGMPTDARFITGAVPPEMREGTELTDADVAKPTERMIIDSDGVPAQLTQIRIPRPAHIPAGPPRVDPFEHTIVPFPQAAAGALRYDFPLFPDVQVHVEFRGSATADHLEQLTELLTVQCKKLREQEARRAAEPRNPAPRKIRAKKEPPSEQ